MKYKIAGIPMEINGVEYDYFSYRLKSYEAPGIIPEIVINYSEQKNIATPCGEIAGRDSFRIFLKNEGRYITYDTLVNPRMNTAITDSSADWSDISCSLSDVEELGGASLSIRSFNMIGELFKFALTVRDGLVIHSSAISYENGGVLFSAPSGTGKSTHTGLWKKVYGDRVKIINDDMPAIRFLDGEWKLCGTPWCGKTGINVNECVPLKGIVFLERGAENEITPISSKEAVFGIMNQTMLPLYKELMSETLENIGKLASAVPAYKLKCNISDGAAITVKEKIFHEN